MVNRTRGAVAFVPAAVAIAGCSVLFGLDGMKDRPGSSDAETAGDSGRADGAEGGGAGETGTGFDPNNDPSLVGWWRFEEGSGATAHDSSGHGNDGQLLNGASWTAGKIGGAVALNGTSSGRVEVPGSSSLQLAALTVALWVNLSSGTTGDPRPISKVSCWDIKFNMGASYQHPQFSLSLGAQTFAEADKSVPFNEWHHIAFAYLDGGAPKPYVDGKPYSYFDIQNFTGAASIPNISSGLSFGSLDGQGGYFPGMLDEIRLYRRALSDDEIQAIFVLK